MSVTVRKAVSGDAHRIAEAEAVYIDCPWTESQVAEEILSETAVFLVAETDGEFCGYVSGAIAADECETSNVAVVERYRRRGIGRALLSAFIGELTKRGVKSVFLLVRDDNAAAVGLYGKCGFNAVGRRKGYYKGRDALIMQLNI